MEYELHIRDKVATGICYGGRDIYRVYHGGNIVWEKTGKNRALLDTMTGDLLTERDYSTLMTEGSRDWLVRDGVVFSVDFLDWNGARLLSCETEMFGSVEDLAPVPVRAHYVFGGWNGGEYRSVSSDLQLTAQYQPEMYSFMAVPEDPGRGSVLQDPAGDRFPYMTAVSLLAQPNEGWHFTTWNDGLASAQRSVTVESDVSLTASFQVNVYTVRFLVDEEVVSEQRVEWGEAAQRPADPEKEGYTFKGWDRDFSKIMSDTDVYAVFEKTVPDDILTFIAVDQDSSITLNKVGNPDPIDLEYYDGSWHDYVIGAEIGIPAGSSIGMRTKRETATFSNSSDSNYQFSMSGKIAAQGSIQYLLSRDGSATSVPKGGFSMLFSGCASLTQAPELPATTLANSCYYDMFLQFPNFSDCHMKTSMRYVYDESTHGNTGKNVIFDLPG